MKLSERIEYLKTLPARANLCILNHDDVDEVKALEADSELLHGLIEIMSDAEVRLYCTDSHELILVNPVKSSQSVRHDLEQAVKKYKETQGE